MTTTINTEKTIARRKNHKGGKFMSLGILWGGVALVVILTISQTVNVLTRKSAQFDRDVVSVTSTGPYSRLQPVSAKIVASDSESMISTEAAISPGEYADVWSKLYRLAPATATEGERLKVIASFLDGLNYKMVKVGGEIVSKSNGDPINPSTLTCYLNGYIPDKPYIKTNCPSF